MKQLPIIYKRTETGAIQQWQIVVEGATYKTTEGQVDGKLTESVATIVEAKNVGRANGTSREEQAIKEAKAKWQKKIDMNGYHTNIKDIDKASLFFEPMLAKKYEDQKDKMTFPVFSQPKLDGMRCILNKDGMWSRQGKRILSAPHIVSQMKPLFDFNPDYIFDGELYADKFADNFNKIISLAKKTKPSPADLQESAELLEYHIYDFPYWEGSFSERFKQLLKVLKHIDIRKTKIKLVNTVTVKEQAHLDELFAEYLEKGYEGQMVRIDDAKYENKRTNQLLKRKTFKDEEYVILDIEEGTGNRSGMAGSMVFKTDDGKIFRANIMGGFDTYKDLWENKKQYIGEKATVKYFQITPDGVPRFGCVSAIRNYE